MQPKPGLTTVRNMKPNQQSKSQTHFGQKLLPTQRQMVGSIMPNLEDSLSKVWIQQWNGLEILLKMHGPLRERNTFTQLEMSQKSSLWLNLTMDTLVSLLELITDWWDYLVLKSQTLQRQLLKVQMQTSFQEWVLSSWEMEYHPPVLFLCIASMDNPHGTSLPMTSPTILVMQQVSNLSFFLQSLPLPHHISWLLEFQIGLNTLKMEVKYQIQFSPSNLSLSQILLSKLCSLMIMKLTLQNNLQVFLLEQLCINYMVSLLQMPLNNTLDPLLCSPN